MKGKVFMYTSLVYFFLSNAMGYRQSMWLARSSRMIPSRREVGIKALRMSLIDCEEGAFEEVVLRSDQPTLVDFYANWCGPCKLIEPLIKKIDAAYGDKLKIVKVNTDVHKELVSQYQIHGLPLIALFKDGEIIQSHEGALGRAEMKGLIDKAYPELSEVEVV